eukprot:175886_1
MATKGNKDVKDPSLNKLPTKFQIYQNCISILNQWIRHSNLSKIYYKSYPEILYKLIIAFHWNAAWLVFNHKIKNNFGTLSFNNHNLSVQHKETKKFNKNEYLTLYSKISIGHMNDYGMYKNEPINDCFIYTVRFRIDDIYNTANNFNFLRIGLKFDNQSEFGGGISNKWCLSFKQPKTNKKFERKSALKNISIGDIIELTVNTTQLFMTAENITKHEKSDIIKFEWIQFIQIAIVIRNVAISIITQWCVDNETLW